MDRRVRDGVVPIRACALLIRAEESLIAGKCAISFLDPYPIQGGNHAIFLTICVSCV